jgi:hypothetical protein
MKARILIMRSRTEGNAPLPFVEFRTPFSHGYNGTDIFSPEMDYCLGPAELPPYLARVNALLAKKGCAPITVAQLTGQVNQLKAFVDVCHLYGLAVLPDVVYNHAGGELDDQSLDFFNRPANPGEANSIYFSTGREAGGKVFNYREPDVREFLIGNARMFLDEYHVDGFRFDQVTVIDNNGGWYFCQNLTDTLRYHKPSAALIAEYWGEHRWRRSRRRWKTPEWALTSAMPTASVIPCVRCSGRRPAAPTRMWTSACFAPGWTALPTFGRRGGSITASKTTT